VLHGASLAVGIRDSVQGKTRGGAENGGDISIVRKRKGESFFFFRTKKLMNKKSLQCVEGSDIIPSRHILALQEAAPIVREEVKE
jgi:hypothetical protein